MFSFNLLRRQLTVAVFALLVILVSSPNALAAKKADLPTAPGLKKILLIPLDSRPPCHEYVTDAAMIAGVEAITPPDNIVDHYKKSGQPIAIGKWLHDNIKQADVAVISIDQLFHGGLIASRKFDRTYDDGYKLRDFLEQLHNEYPDIPIYAFSTLPRITPTEELCPPALWPDFIEYSRLVDQLSLSPDPVKQKRLDELTATLPPDSLKKYIYLFKGNDLINEGLANMVKKGVIKKAIIGQDDGQEFGIANLNKRNLRKYADSLGLTDDDIAIVNGADEIGLSIVAKLIAKEHNYSPTIHLEYNDPSTPRLIMPYMADNVETTVRERLKYLGITEVDDPDKADFTFFVSCVGDKTLATREKSAARIKELISKGTHPALVDLSEHFSADETVFPFLLKNETPINSLSGYAGWNTLSNSVGTALSQIIIFNAARKDAVAKDVYQDIWRRNLNYVVESFLEDYYYLKEEIYPLNSRLRLLGIDVNNFQDDSKQALANKLVDEIMKNDAARLMATKAFQLPVETMTPKGKVRFAVEAINVTTKFPWPRTFEVDLSTNVKLKMLP